jgi:hypothetical protein
MENPKPVKCCPRGQKLGKENAMIFNILATMVKKRNIPYKEAFKL